MFVTPRGRDVNFRYKERDLAATHAVLEYMAVAVPLPNLLMICMMPFTRPSRSLLTVHTSGASTALMWPGYAPQLCACALITDLSICCPKFDEVKWEYRSTSKVDIVDVRQRDGRTFWLGGRLNHRLSLGLI